MDEDRCTVMLGVAGLWHLSVWNHLLWQSIPEGIADEKGMYKYEFEVPEKFRGQQVNLVFEASMTDTEVKVNGRKVGSKHRELSIVFHTMSQISLSMEKRTCWK